MPVARHDSRRTGGQRCVRLPDHSRSSVRRSSHASNCSAAAGPASGSSSCSTQRALPSRVVAGRRSVAAHRPSSSRRTAATPMRLRASAVGVGVDVGRRRAARAARGVAGSASSSGACERRRRRRPGRGTRPGAARRRTAPRPATAAMSSQRCTSRAERHDLGVLARTGRARRRDALDPDDRRSPRQATAPGRRPAGRSWAATSPAYSSRTLASGCSLTTARAGSASAGPVLGRAQRPAGEHPVAAGSRGTAAASSTAARSASGSVWASSPGSLPGGQRGHADLDLVLLLPLVEAVGGALAGRVGVEGQHDAAGEALAAAARAPR